MATLIQPKNTFIDLKEITALIQPSVITVNQTSCTHMWQSLERLHCWRGGTINLFVSSYLLLFILAGESFIWLAYNFLLVEVLHVLIVMLFLFVWPIRFNIRGPFARSHPILLFSLDTPHPPKKCTWMYCRQYLTCQSNYRYLSCVKCVCDFQAY